MIAVVINQIKGKIKNDLWRYQQHIFLRNVIHHIFQYPLKYSFSDYLLHLLLMIFSSNYQYF